SRSRRNHREHPRLRLRSSQPQPRLVLCLVPPMRGQTTRRIGRIVGGWIRRLGEKKYASEGGPFSCLYSGGLPDLVENIRLSGRCNPIRRGARYTLSTGTFRQRATRGSSGSLLAGNKNSCQFSVTSSRFLTWGSVSRPI